MAVDLFSQINDTMNTLLSDSSASHYEVVPTPRTTYVDNDHWRLYNMDKFSTQGAERRHDEDYGGDIYGGKEMDFYSPVGYGEKEMDFYRPYRSSYKAKYNKYSNNHKGYSPEYNTPHRYSEYTNSEYSKPYSEYSISYNPYTEYKNPYETPKSLISVHGYGDQYKDTEEEYGTRNFPDNYRDELEERAGASCVCGGVAEGESWKSWGDNTGLILGILALGAVATFVMYQAIVENIMGGRRSIKQGDKLGEIVWEGKHKSVLEWYIVGSISS